VGEIPSPLRDLRERGQWLRALAARCWPGLDNTLAQWRTNAIEALTGLAADSVVVTHFIVINVAVGAACGDDRVVHFSPDHCSVTRLRVEGGRLVLIERGAQARTRVL
jgi:broad specificity phosphatase PhoE